MRQLSWWLIAALLAFGLSIDWDPPQEIADLAPGYFEVEP